MSGEQGAAGRVQGAGSEEIRVGVFICHCGHNIGGFVDVPAVTEYAKTLPNVVFATHNLYTCADDGLRCIKENIKEHNLNRVIVASCTPRTHAPLFQGACQEAGLNKYLFTFVNIREHCSWVHMKEKEGATRKAKDLVKMGVARVALLAPQQESRVPVEPSSLVIGGGVAGMTAALSLADKGFRVTLAEKEKELGGMVLILYNLYDGGGDPVTMLKPLVEKVQKHPNITVMLNSRLVALDGYVGNFQATVQKTDGSQKARLTVGTIIVATGAIDLLPEGLYGYDVYDNVLNLTEFELLCKKKELPKLQSVAFIQCAGSRGQKVSYCSRICCTVALKGAMKIIDNYDELMGRQPAGGKEQAVEKIRVEEKASDEIADRRRRRRRADDEREERPAAPAAAEGGGVEVTVFNRGITTYGVDHELYYNKAREKRVRFVRFTPERIPVVGREGEKLSVTYWHETLKTERKLLVDMVVLSTPQIAQPDTRELSQMLKVPVGQEGFFLEAHVKLRPVDFATDGIFVCGTAHGPADITESVEQAEAAASRAAIPMMRGYVQAEALTSTVNADECTGCRTCEFTCPYAAISVDPKLQKAVVTDVLCKGCGTCAAGCPRGAITMRHYTSEQIEAEIKAVAECKEA
jgi:heterodisulfide reductase subunit A